MVNAWELESEKKTDEKNSLERALQPTLYSIQFKSYARKTSNV